MRFYISSFSRDSLSPDSSGFVGASSSVFVIIQVEAYMFTLGKVQRRTRPPTSVRAYLSIQLPGKRAATLWGKKPNFAKTDTYHGLSPADRSKTLPPSFKARLRALIWIAASSLLVSNQSMESMIWIYVSFVREISDQIFQNHGPQRLSTWRDWFVQWPHWSRLCEFVIPQMRSDEII